MVAVKFRVMVSLRVRVMVTVRFRVRVRLSNLFIFTNKFSE